ncbi:MAG: VWA domain-containing protein, partial [Rhodobacteraceae bacterium]|nr:VWA domain-containing protein [Paracoccaceae bacterium]
MPRQLMTLLTALTFLLAGFQLGQAQDQGRTILVLDASGSMWGQIDGKAKITIAQEVMGSLLATIPDDQALGLTVYGHRRKGDCNDIETLVQPGTASRDAIMRAVNAIKPKGKTPLSAAVVAAAKELKYTEEKATVILVSDGKETCDFDPCEVGRALEEAGVDFTAHVIGFDVANPADRAQLQCLAENTGGTFKTASNAAELSEALKVVAEPAPPPPPKEGRVRFVAIEGDNGPLILEGLRWSLTNLDSGAVITDMQSAADLDEMLLPGLYRVEVLRSDNETNAELDIRVSQNTDTTFTLVLPLLIPDATISGPDSGIAGASIMVNWTGPDEQGDYIAISELSADDAKWVQYTYSREGSPLGLQMPGKPGKYELRYVLAARQKVLARQAIEVLPVMATLDLPKQALAGETVTVGWTGPDYPSDYLATAATGDPNSKYLTYTYTRDGSPLGLVMPSVPGSYEVRYVMNQDASVIARAAIEVVAVSATLTAPDTAGAGATVMVEWQGPDYERDYISVARPGESGSSYVNYTYSRQGSPAALLMPAEPGEYEIRYIMNQDNKILAQQAITVTEVGASLSAPVTAEAGSSVMVEWQGPDYPRDFIAVTRPGEAGGKVEQYVYTKEGSPVRLRMPANAGE